MKFFRYIALFLAVTVIMGHDLVPHLHESDNALSEDISVSPSIVNASQIEETFSHLLGHIKHDASANSLVDLVTIEKKMNTGYDLLYTPPPESVELQGVVWYSNLKKQRFWGNTEIACQSLLFSFSHRGPPAVFALA